MYEIVSMIKEASPSYDFYEEDDRIKNGNRVLDEIFEYIDQLEKNFPAIDANTYCMIVCGAIMQCFVSDLAYCSELGEEYFDRLRSGYADERMRRYFVNIFYAIDSIPLFYHFNEWREILDWPWDFSFEKDEGGMSYFHQHLLEAIRECPEYSYAYCLVDVPYLCSLSGITFKFEKAEKDLKKAFLDSHRRMGDELFSYLYSGNFQLSPLVYDVIGGDGEEEEHCYADDVAGYVLKKGYSVGDVEKMEIQGGYYCIDGKRYPAGIPFFKHFVSDEFEEFLNTALEEVPLEESGKISTSLLLEQGKTRIEYKQYALYGGMCFLMPLYDSYPELSRELSETFHRESLNKVLAALLDVSAEEMDKLEEANEQLHIVNESLKRHIRLNQELVRNLSHSSANYLNSDKLARTGSTLQRAEKDSPTVDELHLEGLSLLLQSEQEMFLSRQLNSLVWRCSADSAALTRQIRSGLSKTEGASILSPIEFALKTVMARVLFREGDRRGEFIQRKMQKTEETMTRMKSDFMLDILAGDANREGHVLEWWNQHVGHIVVSTSEVWKSLKIIRDKSFFDLITEIVTEQILNALSHGDIHKEICIELGQAEEFHGRPRWAFVACRNTCGEVYSGGRSVGIFTLNEAVRLINSDKRGIETDAEGDCFECKAWLLASLLRAI